MIYPHQNFHHKINNQVLVQRERGAILIAPLTHTNTIF